MKPKSSQTIAITGRETELQRYGTVINRPLSLDHKVRLSSVGSLNQILADTMTLRIPLKWGTDSAEVGQRRSEATPVTVMISEVPHLRQDLSLVSASSIISFPSSRFCPGTCSIRSGAGFRCEVARFRSMWGHDSAEVGNPNQVAPRQMVRSFPAVMVPRGPHPLAAPGSRSVTTAFPFPPPCVVHDPSSQSGSGAGPPHLLRMRSTPSW